MNKNQFLSALREKLKMLPQNEIDSAITYYDEYISDAGVENEAETIESLGDPGAVAAKIVGEYTLNDVEAKKTHSLKPLWIVIIAIFASPVALPIAIAIVVVAITLIVSLFVIVVSFTVSGVAVAINGLVSLAAGLWAFTQSAASTGVFYIGYAAVCLPLGTAITLGALKLAKTSFLGIQKLLGKFLLRRGTK